jgi:endonuclease/exonuclease/phosphatase family metal-dependent hydrolase
MIIARAMASFAVTAGLAAVGLVAPSGGAVRDGAAGQVQLDATVPPEAPKAVKVGKTSIKLSWPRHELAWHYEVRYGTQAGGAGGTVTDIGDRRRVGGLSNATRYHVQYRAVSGARDGRWDAVAPRSAWSEPLRLRTSAAVPGKFTAVKATGGIDRIRLRWKKTRNTTRYTVKVADNRGMTRNLRTYPGISGTRFTIRNLTRGSRSGMPSYVRIRAHNKGLTMRDSKRYRVYPAPPKVSGAEKISVASYNVLCAVCTPGTSKAPSWQRRVPAMMKTIRAKKPGVILLQEALNVPVPGSPGVLAMKSFSRKLNRAGYRLDRQPEKASRHIQNRVAYKQSRYTLLRSGTFRLPTPRNERVRGASWAKLESKSTGRKFFAVSYHVSPELPLRGAKSKTSTMRRVDRKMRQLNPHRRPVVAGGDMNSGFNQPPGNVPHRAMIRAGWTDAASAVKRDRAEYPTYNGYRKRQKKTLSRIDYIFTKNIRGTLSYENVVKVDRKGRLRSLPGSDHNMVLARMKLR